MVTAELCPGSNNRVTEWEQNGPSQVKGQFIRYAICPVCKQRAETYGTGMGANVKQHEAQS